jgi:hypothetical protein
VSQKSSLKVRGVISQVCQGLQKRHRCHIVAYANGESRFWHDWNDLELRKSVLVLVEWFEKDFGSVG